MVINGLDAWSIGTLLQTVTAPPGRRLHLGRVVAAAAVASMFVLDCPLCTGRVPAWTDEPSARLPPPALEPA